MDESARQIKINGYDVETNLTQDEWSDHRKVT